MKKLIRVTKADIANGRPRFASSCPIARAIGRATGTRTTVWPVSSDFFAPWFATFRNETGGYASVRLAERAARFAGRFDAGLAVEPFNFYLELP